MTMMGKFWPWLTYSAMLPVIFGDVLVKVDSQLTMKFTKLPLVVHPVSRLNFTTEVRKLLNPVLSAVWLGYR